MTVPAVRVSSPQKFLTLNGYAAGLSAAKPPQVSPLNPARHQHPMDALHPTPAPKAPVQQQPLHLRPPGCFGRILGPAGVGARGKLAAGSHD